MTDISDLVRSLYAKYPYPPREAGTGVDPYIDYILSFSREKREGPPSFLDAGCGTGASVIGAALFQQELQVYGCDFNPASLSEIQRDVEELELKNVQLAHLNLLDLPSDFGPPGGFDVIFCTGVIHHIPDPLRVIKNLAARLAPQGVLRLMVYSRRGREGLYRYAKVVEDLIASGSQTLEEQVTISMNLMTELHESEQRLGSAPPVLRGPFSDSHRLSSAEFADRYHHPHDVPYTLESLQELIEDSGLRFLNWFEKRNWDLEELLPETCAKGEFPDQPWERYAVVEELFDRDQYDLYLVGPDFQANDAPLTFDCRLRINPQVHLTEVSFRGFGFEHRAKLLFYPEESLNVRQAKLLTALKSRTSSLGELLDEWGEARSKEWLLAALYLFYREYVYRPIE